MEGERYLHVLLAQCLGLIREDTACSFRLFCGDRCRSFQAISHSHARHTLLSLAFRSLFPLMRRPQMPFLSKVVSFPLFLRSRPLLASTFFYPSYSFGLEYHVRYFVCRACCPLAFVPRPSVSVPKGHLAPKGKSYRKVGSAWMKGARDHPPSRKREGAKRQKQKSSKAQKERGPGFQRSNTKRSQKPES